MQAQITASIRHLKQAAHHLLDAKLIIEGVNKTAAQFIEGLLKGTREQIRDLEVIAANEDQEG